MRTSNRLFKLVDQLIAGTLLVSAWIISKFAKPVKVSKPLSVRKILFSKFCCQGDSLLSLYALRSFRRQHPNAKMIAVCGQKTEEVYCHSGIFDQVIPLAISGQKGVDEMFSANLFLFLSQLRKAGPFDVYVDMDLYYCFSPLIGYWVRADRRIGFATSKVRRLGFTDPLVRQTRQSEVICFYDLLTPLGIRQEEPGLYEFAFLDRAANQAQLTLQQLGWDGKKQLIGLVPGSSPSWPVKRWPLGRFAEMVAQILAWRPVHFLVFGTAAEADLGKFLKRKNPNACTDLIGKTNFTDLVGYLSICSLFIGNDSGPMHLADMLQIPVIAIFGPTDEHKWGPFGTHAKVVKNEQIDCRPCYYLSNMPNCKHLNCLRNIPVPTVVELAQKVLLEDRAV